MTGISEAYAVVVGIIAKRVGTTPLARGIHSVEAGDWTLTVNASPEPLATARRTVPLEPWTALAEHHDYFVVALLHPAGGMIGGGMPEAEFIEQMNALAAEADR